MKPFLLLATRAEDATADNGYESFLAFARLDERDLRRSRLEQQALGSVDLQDWSGILLAAGRSTPATHRGRNCQCSDGSRKTCADRGPKPQHESQLSAAELGEAAAWIRQRSRQLRHQCQIAGQRHIDVGALGFHDAMQQARRHLLGPNPPGS